MGSTLGALGWHAEALEHYKKALELQIELLGKKHPEVAASYNNMGISLGALGRHAEALEAKKKALELQRELLGEQHPNVVKLREGVRYVTEQLNRDRLQNHRPNEREPLLKTSSSSEPQQELDCECCECKIQ